MKRAVYLCVFLGCVFLVISIIRAQDPQLREFAQTSRKVLDIATVEPKSGTVHVLHFDGTKIAPETEDKSDLIPFRKINIRFVQGMEGKFRLDFSGDLTGDVSLGQSDRPWMRTAKGTVFLGDKSASELGVSSAFPFVRDDVRKQLPILRSFLKTIAVAGALPIKIKDRDRKQLESLKAGFVQLELDADLTGIDFEPQNTSAEKTNNVETVASEDLYRQFSALVNFAADRLLPRIPPFAPLGKTRKNPDERIVLAKASNGRGLLAEQFGRKILFLEGTPAEMGAAQGELQKESIAKTIDRVVYGMGAVTSLGTGKWFYQDLAEIERRTTPFIPPRFYEEIDAMSDASGMSNRDGRFGNLFPERFHCSGVAVHGKATKDGRLYHARVLDYMSDILLQEVACLQVFLPKDHYRWVSHGYAGFVGTVTAINEKGLAMGEMGGRGEGNWDGLPMSMLMREIMERAATVDEALEILKSTKLTCEYYYILSDASKNMVGLKCTPDEVLVLKPGEQHELLPPVPEDTVLMSAGDRAKKLSERLHEQFGKIDAESLIEIIKRPVAMRSNLHNAVFTPESKEIRVSDASCDFKVVPACDQPYHLFQLDELFRFYEERKK